ncbi:glycosyltransferase family 87 protein [Spirosoma luteum]|uniref:glycosyltransferase family 87 protein n=1 Tax=Spirosoma luteum TaxID=431553 RepID=UPI00035F9BAE|nr:glycosyltransferase family 87 protein [Spirosoma luteum]
MTPFYRHPLFSNIRFIVGTYAVLALLASVKLVFFEGSGVYSIFYYSLTHLLEGKSLYAAYPAEYVDHYHYAPTFAALFAPVFALPYSVGLFIWQPLFTAVWFYAIYRMPFTQQQKVFAYWFCLQELFTSLVNSQTNPLIAALSLFTFLSFERRQPIWAAFFIVLGFNIKIYSLVAGALFLLYPQKLRFLAYALGWGVVMALLPLLLTPPDKLLWQYDLWVNQLLIKSDVDKWLNLSIHRLVHQTISPAISTSAIIGAGVLVFCTVYIRVKRYTEPVFRLLMVASVLLFQVIFNPVSESPTYITAVTGVMCWWVCCPQNWLDRSLLIACFVFTVLSPSDIFPTVLREQLVKPYVLKALPCVLIWFRVIYLMHSREEAVVTYG